MASSSVVNFDRSPIVCSMFTVDFSTYQTPCFFTGSHSPSAHNRRSSLAPSSFFHSCLSLCRRCRSLEGPSSLEHEEGDPARGDGRGRIGQSTRGTVTRGRSCAIAAAIDDDADAHLSSLCCAPPPLPQLCVLSFAAAAAAPEHVYMEETAGLSAEEQGWLLSEEHQHSLLAQAAQMQAKAEAQAIAERQEQGAEATPLNTPETMPTPEEDRISRLAAAPVDPETERMLHVFREDQFPENTDATIRDLPGWANKRVDSELKDQLENGFTIKSVGVDGIMLESKTKEEAAEEARLEAALEQAADEGVAADAYEAAFTNQAEQMYASAEQATEQQAMTPDQRAEAELRADAARELEERAMAARARAAHEAMGGYEAMEADAYPSMLEIDQSAEKYPSGVEHSVHGIMSKLRRKIMAVAQKEIAKRAQQHKQSTHAAAPRGHSFIAARSHAHAKAQAKEGDQWWLQKAPFFLPPPPEWGPMPVTMYTSYYHKPTAGYSHLDYAHGIPLPHADALGMARRTYPQPPFEQPQAGASPAGEAEAGAEAGEAEAFMELASEEHVTSESSAAADAEQAELEAAEAELEAEAAQDDTMLEVEAEAEPESEYEPALIEESTEGGFELEAEAAKVL